jgi:hypothetical protein
MLQENIVIPVRRTMLVHSAEPHPFHLENEENALRNWHHHRHHGNFGAGLGIGLLSGVIIGGALAAPSYDYPRTYGYYPYPNRYRYRYAPYSYGYYSSEDYYPAYRYYRPYPSYRTYYRPRNYYRVGGGDSHISWCYSRYRSYRAWDNTFQPYYGPRRACRSPYD